jgi:hypothetical protein
MNKILSAFGAFALVVALGVGSAYAAWGPAQFNWPNNSTIGGALTVSNAISGGIFYNVGVAAGNTPIDMSVANLQRILMPAGNTTFVFSNPWPGEEVSLLIQQDSVGSRTVTWPTNIKWTGGSAPTLTTGASKTDCVTLVYDSNGNWYEKAIELNE